jgi:hypothetical protein
MNLEQPQVMRCLFCYNAPLNVSNPRFNLMLQNKWYNILKKQVDVNHHLISKKIEEVQNMVKGNVERKPTKKHLNLFGSSMSIFSIVMVSFKKEDIP